ncbi:MAG: hypothetical protein JWO69_1007, partial [Thermoleophilia bacterium]|nr:hypothetical protein [Thermoleophilia bacterium]
MDIALSLLLLWGLLFLPIGLVLHWLVLGEGACVRALPVAPVTGVATAFLVLAGLGRLGVDAGTAWVPWLFVAASAVSAIVIWRGGVPWRSRELIGATALLLFAVLLVQLPVVGSANEGPLGYGTAADPVQEVAAIDAAADGPAADLDIAREAAATADDRPIGFEQFAALTVAIGRSDSAPTSDVEWSGYGLHSAITGMLAVLTALPLFAFARARGVGAFGLIVLIPLGVLTPYGFLALANGSGAAIASVPFLIAGAFSLLVTRRDRGWWALVVLFGAAAVASAGALALLPLVTTGFAWMFLRSHTYEHLSQHDAPVSRRRTFAVTSAAAVLGSLSVVTTLTSGTLLAWPRLHDGLLDTIRSWPFTWLDTDLSTAGPIGAVETVVWLVGPVLLIVAAIEAVTRNERRELGVMAGFLLALAIGLAAAAFDRDAGIRLVEFVLLACSPLLASLAVRGVSLARETSDTVPPSRLRFVRLGPALIVAAFVLLSVSATAVTGSRMVHAPELARVSSADAADGGRTLIAGGDPWLAFVVDGERTRGGSADSDELTGTEPSRSDHSITFGEAYDQLVLSSSPLASDPPLRWFENSTLDAYQARAFTDRARDPTATRDLDLDEERVRQRTRSAAAGASADAPNVSEDPVEGAVDAAKGSAAPPPRVTASYTPPTAHEPVEEQAAPADRPAGLLLPHRDVPGCSVTNDITDQSTCNPRAPQLGPGCTPDDLAAVRSPLDKAAPAARATERDVRTQLLRLDTDYTQQDQPALIGVQCFDVELRDSTSVLLLHVRDVGIVLAPEEASSVGTRGAWSIDEEAGRSGRTGGVNGGVRRVTNELDAALRFGNGRLFGDFELVMEGEFGAGVDLASTSSLATTTDGEPDDPEAGAGMVSVDELRGSADGFSKVLRSVALQGNVTLTNQAGTDIELGRLFARPRDLPRSCDFALPPVADQRRELRIEGTAPGADAIEKPGISTAIVDITDEDGVRTARVAVGSYLSNAGLPRHLLVDWT